jgi:hypothetical protein
MRANGRAWRCFRYKDIDHILNSEHECALLRLPRAMASMVIFPYQRRVNTTWGDPVTDLWSVVGGYICISCKVDITHLAIRSMPRWIIIKKAEAMKNVE